jgi:hypothetical protein
VPDHWRKALRTGLGVLICVAIGCSALSSLGGTGPLASFSVLNRVISDLGVIQCTA